MNGLGTGRRLRATAVWAATTVGLVLLLRWCAPDLPGPRGPEDFAGLLVSGFAALLALCGCWWWLVTSIVGVQVWRSAAPGRTPGVPVAARRLLLAACGVALVGATAAPTVAAPIPDPGPVARSPLTGLPLPERPLGGLHAPHAPPAAPEVVVVAPGDSLWSIAAAHLGGRATDAETTAYWQRLHRLNRSTIGPDPDLIRPGQRLVLPDRPPS